MPDLAYPVNPVKYIPDYNEDSPGFLSVDVREMYSTYDMIDALRGGTKAMREAGPKYLPKEEAEEPDYYTVRLHSSFLYEALVDTVEKISAKPFVKPVSLKIGENTKLPWWLTSFQNNADKEGSSFTAICNKYFESAVYYGAAHTVIDFPKTGGDITKEQEEAEDIRAFVEVVEAPQVLGWKEQQINNTTVVSEFRYWTKEKINVGKYGDRQIIVINVWTSTEKARWHQKGPGEYVLLSRVEHNLNSVPVETFYTRKKKTMLGDPPFKDLAWMNIAHWQTDSMQRNILRFARIGVMFLAGITESDIERAFGKGATPRLAPGSIIAAGDHQASAEYVEMQGASIQHGRADLEDLEKKMHFQGLLPVMSQSNYSTAFGREKDEEKQFSELNRWEYEGEIVAENIIKRAYKYQNEKVPEELEAQFVHDSSNKSKNDLFLRYITELFIKNRLPAEEAFEAYKELGMFPEKFNSSDIAKKVQALIDQERKQNEAKEKAKQRGTQQAAGSS